VPNVGNVVRVLDVPFTAITADQLLTVESSSAAIPADGFSIATITARLTTNGNRQQAVKFSTSLGKLVRSAGADGAATDTVTADAQGVATIVLRSENTVGTAIVTAETLGFTRQVLVSFGAVNPNDIITLRAEPSTAPADGPNGNGVQLKATIGASIPQRLRTVTFTSSLGTLSDASATPDAGNVAQTTLKSDSPGNAVVSATVAGVTTRTTVQFVRALPEAIFLEATKATVTKVGDDSTKITATLTREVGQIANNTIVTYSAVDSAGNTIGRFTDITPAKVDDSDSSPSKRLVSTATFNPDDTAASGAVTITATVGSVKQTIIIQIQ
jgi:hypothetical protein